MRSPMILLDASWWTKNKPDEDHPIAERFRELERLYRLSLNALSGDEFQWSTGYETTDSRLCPIDELSRIYTEAMWIIRCLGREQCIEDDCQ